MTDAPDELWAVSGELHPLLLEADRPSMESAAQNWKEHGLAVGVVFGGKARTLHGLYAEFASALKFPDYFGQNRDAFDECIADLEGLATGSGYVVLIAEPDKMLIDSPDADFEWLVISLSRAAREYGHPISQGEPWDRPAIPFHVVLTGEWEVLERARLRWAMAGAEPVVMGRPR